MSVNYLNDVRADDRTLRELFAVDPSRAQRYVAQLADLRIDWSRQPVTDEVLDSLRSAARTAGVRALSGTCRGRTCQCHRGSSRAAHGASSRA